MKIKLAVYVMAFMCLGVLVFSCKEEDSGQDTLENSSVNFVVAHDSILPSGDSLTMELELNKKAGINGHILIRLSGDASHTTDYLTKPEAVNGVITLNLAKDAQKAEFAIIRAGNLLTNKAIHLALENPSHGFVLGNKTSATVKLLKKVEVTDSINFTDVFIHISENEPQAFEISLSLKGTLTQAEQVVIEITNAEGIEYGSQYNTQPAAVQNKLTLNVPIGAQTVSFKMLPVNDNLFLGKYELIFKINTVTGQLRKGNYNQLTVRVEEDDKEQAIVHSIAGLKQIFDEHQDEFWIPDDYFIEGIITSGSNVADDKTVYIQDSTGGIMLRYIATNLLHLGDKVRVNLKNASGNLVNDQKTVYNVEDRLGVKLDSNLIVEPEVITLQQLTSGNYDGKRVKIMDVKFEQANGNLTFQGTRQIAVGTATGNVTTYISAPFSNTILPTGTFTITGIVGDWGRLLPQVYETDIFKTGK